VLDFIKTGAAATNNAAKITITTINSVNENPRASRAKRL
jgi:hypothetical protein